MSVIWSGILVLSLICACTHGTVPEIAAAVIDGAQSGISLAISLAGILCLWSGVCRVMEAAGLSARIARLLRPLLRKLLPNCNEDAFPYVSANVAANLLGLGNAATPLGMEAVRRMKNGTSDRASDEMCRFIVLNTASIQLLPTTVSAVRGAAGAAAPFDILPAVWMTSAAALTVGLLTARLLERLWVRRGW